MTLRFSCDRMSLDRPVRRMTAQPSGQYMVPYVGGEVYQGRIPHPLDSEWKFQLVARRFLGVQLWNFKLEPRRGNRESGIHWTECRGPRALAVIGKSEILIPREEVVLGLLCFSAALQEKYRANQA
jgi:hypothetical protein